MNKWNYILILGVLLSVSLLALQGEYKVNAEEATEEIPDYVTGYFDPIVPILENTNQGDPGEHLVTTPQELETAIADAVPGDVIIMQDGTWTDIDILFKAVGTEEQPITLKAQTQGEVVISGSSSMRISGQYLVVDGLHFKDGSSSQSLHVIEFRDGQDHAYHSRLTNVVISEFNKDRARTDSTDVWVGLFGSYNRVDHSYFHGKTSESVLMIVWRGGPEANYHRIDHNYFKDIPNIGLGGATAIRIGDGMQALTSSRTTIEDNLFENMLGIGKVINIKSGENTIRNNTFVRASGSITVRQGNGNLIEGNVILPGLEDRYTGGLLLIGQDHIIRNNYIQGTRNSGKAAITLYEGELNNYPGKGGYYPSKNVVIENNTLVDNDKNMIIGQLYDPESELTVPVENVTFRENVVLGNGNMTPMIIVLDEPNGSTYEENHFFNGNFHGIEDVEGIVEKQPALQLTENGMYEYTAANTLRNNQITTPLLRTEVGPEWIQPRWAELGIEDTPYIDLPVENLIQETEMETEVEADAETVGSEVSTPAGTQNTVQDSASEASASDQAGTNSSVYWIAGVFIVFVVSMAIGFIIRRRVQD